MIGDELAALLIDPDELLATLHETAMLEAGIVAGKRDRAVHCGQQSRCLDDASDAACEDRLRCGGRAGDDLRRPDRSERLQEIEGDLQRHVAGGLGNVLLIDRGLSRDRGEL